MNKIVQEPIETFRSVVEEAHGFEPFKWQERLFEKVHKDGCEINLRKFTGFGKTLALDAVLVDTAIKLARGESPSDLPLRILYTIDRRQVVDQTKEHSEEIQSALRNPNSKYVKAVSKQFQKVSSSGEPLEVSRWRGGLSTSGDLPNPTQPAIITCTSHQVGSRAMFRGFGVSKKMSPVHAGLVGHGSVIVLDEAHLSVPFRKMVKRINNLRDGGFKVLPMSATVLEDHWKDRGIKESEEVVKRKDAVKKAERVKAKGGGSERHQITSQGVEETEGFIEDDRFNQIGLVFNRVRSAREASKQLLEEDVKVLTLIGRAREFDKQIVRKELRGLSDDQEVVIVATQTVEVGVDLNLDALVTELCPLDALFQRFGRLDRYGEFYEEHGETVNAKIIASEDMIKKKTYYDDVYGKGILNTTLSVLNEYAKVKSRPKTFRVDYVKYEEIYNHIDEEDVRESFNLSDWEAPIDSVLADNLTKTYSEYPIDVSKYIQEPDMSPGDVSVVWREDVSVGDSEDELTSKLKLLPPTQTEVMELPVWSLDRWVESGEFGPLSDFLRSEQMERGDADQKVIRWDWDEGAEVVPVSVIKPGDTVILPSDFGGVRDSFFDPSYKGEVEDIAEKSRLREKRDRRIRVDFEGWSYRDMKDQVNLNDIPLDWNSWPKEAPDIVPYGDEKIAIWKDDFMYGQTAPEDVTLETHMKDVAELVDKWAKSLDLPDHIREALVFAAKYHDLGKGDPRWQAYLRGGEWLTDKLLAKISEVWTFEERKIAKEKSGRKSGMRHEQASVQLLEGSKEIEKIEEPELALYLISTHHGYGRPHFPEVDNEGTEVSVEVFGNTFQADVKYGSNIEQVQRFSETHSRFDSWEIGFLESIIRLADHKVSKNE